MDSTLSPSESCDLQINPVDVSASPTYIHVRCAAIDETHTHTQQWQRNSVTCLPALHSTYSINIIDSLLHSILFVLFIHLYFDHVNKRKHEISDKFDTFWPNMSTLFRNKLREKMENKLLCLICRVRVSRIRFNFQSNKKKKWNEAKLNRSD